MARPSFSKIVGFLFSSGLLLIVMGAFFLYAYPAAVADEEAMYASASRISGIVGIKNGGGQSTGIALYDSTGAMLFSCYQGDCGYPDWRSDIGRNAIFEVLDGRVTRVSVEGEQRFSPHDSAKAIEQHRNRATVMLILGFVLLIAAIATNAKATRSRSETRQ